MSVEREYTYTEAAELLGVSEDWLRLYTPRKFPHRKYSNTGKGPARVMFSAAHIAEIRAMYEVRPADEPERPLDELRPSGRGRRRPVTRRAS